MSDRRPPTVSEDTMKKIMWLYRTRNCPLNKRGQCNYGARCFDSHEASPERRAPKQNEYNDWHPSTMKCTSNSPKESCKYGRACYFAHNDFEVNYHPTMYKSKLCAQFEKDGTCQLGMICPDYHYPEEQRKIEKGSISSDCKSDGLSRKAPPPQEFRRWLDEELRRQKVTKFSENSNASINGDTANHHITNKLVEEDTQQQLSEQKSEDIVDSILDSTDDHLLNNSKLINADELQMNVVSVRRDDDDDNDDNHTANILSLDSETKLADELKIDSTNSQSVENGGDREQGCQPNIENEVEIELPSSSHPLSNLSGPNLMLRNISDSPSTRFMSPQIQSPFNGSEHEDKWQQQKKNQSRVDQHITSPQLNRALSTPSSLPSIPQSHQGANFQPLGSAANIYYSQSHGPMSTASIVSARSNRSSNRSQRSGKSGKSGRSKKSKKSSKSVRSDKTKSSRASKKQRKSSSSKSSSTKRDDKLKQRDTENRSNGSNKRRSLKKKKSLREKRERLERAALDIIKTYKIRECETTKCSDVFCVNYHSLEERRRDPFTANYVSEPCPRIFDEKQRKFLDNGYGCPMNDACEFAHNYLELWYHPNVFHTKKCPLVKYHKKCAWGFKCSHYHKKAHKRIIGAGGAGTAYLLNNGAVAVNNVNGNNHQLSKQIQRGNYSPMSSSQFSSISHTHSYHHSHNVTAVAPPNLPNQPQLTHPHIAHSSPMGPHRPPLANKSAPSLHSHHHQLAPHHMMPAAHTDMNPYAAMAAHNAYDTMNSHTSFDMTGANAALSNGLIANSYEQHNAAVKYFQQFGYI